MPAPTVLLAGAAYQSGVEAERAAESALVPERAYVVAGLADNDALTRALSVARESHLVTAPPDRLTAELQAIHAREIVASMDAIQAEAAARAELLAGAERQAATERSRELAIEAALQQAEAQRQAERGAEHEVGHGDG